MLSSLSFSRGADCASCVSAGKVNISSMTRALLQGVPVHDEHTSLSVSGSYDPRALTGGDIDLPGHYGKTRVDVSQNVEMEICYLRVLDRFK